MSASGKHFYFIGICGTAMGAVAAAMKERGFAVSGSDSKMYEPMASFLKLHGINAIDGYRASNIPADADTIVIGNAISRGNEECEAVLERRLLYTSLPELLKHHFLRGRRNLVVTGTHGKTTTASLLAWMLESAGRRPSFMIGGITRNFGQGARFTDSEFFVLEGDEYDTAFFDKRSKFVHYLPELVVVNNLEFDHADIFKNLEEIKRSFSHLLRLVPRNGLVVVNGDDANAMEAARDCPAPIRTVGVEDGRDFRITDIESDPEGTTFRINGAEFFIPMDGEFNVRNAAVAVVAARFGGLDDDEIRDGLRSFEGVARRQEVRGLTAGGVKIIDDFGHHPTAILQTAEALRRRHLRDRARLWAVFEPRSNTTRRNIFQNELAVALSAADGAVVAAIPDPQKVPGAERLDVDRLVSDIHSRNGGPCFVEPNADAIVARLKPLVKSGDVIVVFSNGGFGGIHEKLLAM
jgi:UDP-N-acetylmuramate: L-alanyl-gamma-D-glutamyl-meso-diaminopimelate ligase